MTTDTRSEAPKENMLLGPENIRAIIRERIFTGELSAESTLSQVQLAEELRVSRTPVREALRMLEAEGLVVAERNRRMVVAALSVEDLEYAYAGRIVLEAFAARMTLPELTQSDLSILHGELKSMEESASRHDFDTWEVHHEQFHKGLVKSGGPIIVRQIDQMQAQGRRFRSHYMTSRPSEAWSRAAIDHHDVLAAFRDGDPDVASERLASHLASTALMMVAAAHPSYDPVAIRTALRTVTMNSLTDRLEHKERR